MYLKDFMCLKYFIYQRYIAGEIENKSNLLRLFGKEIRIVGQWLKYKELALIDTVKGHGKFKV